jgi:opacity protein-like surface antigen
MGVQGGVEWLNASRDFVVTHTPTSTREVYALNRKTGSKSPVLGASFGYQRHKSCYFWGVEGLVQMTNNRKAIIDTSDPVQGSDSSHLRKTLSLGIMGRMGIPLPGGSPYVFTGLELSRFSLLFSSDIRRKHTFFRPAFVLGAGVERDLSKKLSLRLAYGWRIFQDADKRFREGNYLVQHAAKKMTSNTVTLGVFWRFKA